MRSRHKEDELADRRLYTVEESALQLGCSRSALYPRLISGELRSVKLGRSRRIAAADLEAFVERLRSETHEAGTSGHTAANERTVTRLQRHDGPEKETDSDRLRSR